MSKKPKVIVLSGYGLNSEEETKFGFDLAGAAADIVHVNDIIAAPKKLASYEILAVPGGFAYGDDTGSGKAYANKLRNHLSEAIQKFVERDTLTIGICNGFQILTNFGLLPGALTFNDCGYTDRWVDVTIVGESPWLQGIEKLSMVIAHGEGKYVVDKKILQNLRATNAIAMHYAKGEICDYQHLPPNPNGSEEAIAGVLAKNGRIFGLMPHPERSMFFTQHPMWPLRKEEYIRAGMEILTYGPSLKIFQNAVRYLTE